MTTTPTVWVLEVRVRGVWKPTSTVWLTGKAGVRVVTQMNVDDASSSYRLTPYARAVEKGVRP